MRIAIPLIPCAIRGPLSRPNRLHHRDLALNFVKLKLNFELLAQLKAKQAAEKAKEEALLLQQRQEVERRYAEREMEIAAAKM